MVSVGCTGALDVTAVQKLKPTKCGHKQRQWFLASPRGNILYQPNVSSLKYSVTRMHERMRNEIRRVIVLVSSEHLLSGGG